MKVKFSLFPEEDVSLFSGGVIDYVYRGTYVMLIDATYDSISKLHHDIQSYLHTTDRTYLILHIGNDVLFEELQQ